MDAGKRARGGADEEGPASAAMARNIAVRVRSLAPRGTPTLADEIRRMEAQLRAALRHAGMLEAQALRLGRTDAVLDRRYLAAVGAVDEAAVRLQALIAHRIRVCREEVVEARAELAARTKDTPDYRTRVTTLAVPSYRYDEAVAVPRSTSASAEARAA